MIRHNRLYLALVLIGCMGVSEHILRLAAHFAEGDQNKYSIFGLPTHALYWLGLLKSPTGSPHEVSLALEVVCIVWFTGLIAVFGILAVYIVAKSVAALIRWAFGAPVRNPTTEELLIYSGLGIVAFSAVITWSFHYSIPAPLLLILDVIGISLALEALRRGRRRCAAKNSLGYQDKSTGEH